MPRGRTCPRCGTLTYQDIGSVYECTQCHFVGWPWNKAVKDVGKGKGQRCPWCHKQTLQNVKEFEEAGFVVRRCSVCGYSAIQPPT